jgi:dihydrofolate reductase/thymidylate synthase
MTTSEAAAAGENAKRRFQVVVAADELGGVGKNGALPWKLSKEMKHFKSLTSDASEPMTQNAVIMGRKTWESIPEKFRPLPGRLNVVLSASGQVYEKSNKENGGRDNDAKCLPEGVLARASIEEALETLSNGEYKDIIEKVFVIGGAKVYEEALKSEQCEAVHLTEVKPPAGKDPKEYFASDAFIPLPLDSEKFRLYSSSKLVKDGECSYTTLTYVAQSGPAGKFRVEAEKILPQKILKEQKHEEMQYLELIKEIIEEGNVKGDRTGTGTISKFGCSMRYDLRRSFPLLTSKRVFWRGVAEELLWFVKGSTNANELKEKGVGIWDGNGSREYLDSIGLSHREVNDLGPVYGFQWRHFNAEYTDMHADYTGKGVDQLAEVIHKIKNNPNDRRILLTAWNPAALKEMALPPCHMFCQFYVANGELSCQMYQRSCDMGLGVPFNIASYSLLTCMIAQVCDLKPGDFVHVLGDAHVYANHVEPLKTQLKNEPRPFPQLKINPDVKDIDGFKFEDFEIIGYDPCPKIEMKMAV